MQIVSAIACCLAAALMAPAASAQTLYKSTMPDGKVIYGDKPMPDAVKVEKSKPDTSKKGVAPPTKGEAATLKELEAARLKREGAQGRVQASEQALRDAEARLAAGKEPVAGERLGTASGQQRLTDDYWARQKKLEQDVENARRALDQVRSGK